MSLIIESSELWLASTNCYVAASEPGGLAIVIDAPPEPTAIGELLAEHNLTPVGLLLTHGHVDHSGGAGGFVGQSGVSAYVHPDDDFLTLHPSEQIRQLFGATLSEGDNNDFMQPPEYEELVDGMSLELAGLTVDVIHTPGHTPGHCCFFLKEEEVLFSGDQLFSGAIGRTDLLGGDYDTLMASMRDKVLPLPGETRVFPGHGPATTLNREQQVNPFLQEFSSR